MVTVTGENTGERGIRLWSNGPIWAECNIGAAKPEEYGMYYTFEQAQWVACSPWHTPTAEQLRGLIENCDAQWTDNYNGTGTAGFIVTGRGEYSANSIFLPAGGYWDDGEYTSCKISYWSSDKADPWEGVPGCFLPCAMRLYRTRTGKLDVGEFITGDSEHETFYYTVRPVR